jgi:hypothetical protein
MTLTDYGWLKKYNAYAKTFVQYFCGIIYKFEDTTTCK